MVVAQVQDLLMEFVKLVQFQDVLTSTHKVVLALLVKQDTLIKVEIVKFVLFPIALRFIQALVIVKPVLVDSLCPIMVNVSLVIFLIVRVLLKILVLVYLVILVILSTKALVLEDVNRILCVK